MKDRPFYCRKAFWTSTHGVLLTVGGYLAHCGKLDWLAWLLLAAGNVCGNLGSVIAAGPEKKTDGD